MAAKRNRIKFNCEYCGAESEKIPSDYNKSKRHFCSHKCYANANSGESHNNYDSIETSCSICEEDIILNRFNFERSDSHYCSKECQSIGQIGRFVGDKSPLWKGRRTLISRIRCSYPANIWRKKVLERDGYVCQECGSLEQLEAHHIIEFNKLMTEFEISTIEEAKECKELWDTDNGIALCIHCHADKHPKEKKFILKRVA